jgi:hypothetical protein
MSTGLALYRLVFPNGKLYFGITVSMTRRIHVHRHAAKQGFRTPVYQAIRKYGFENVRCECLVVGSKEYIADLEIRAIATFNTCDPRNGYNVHRGGLVGSYISPAGRKSIGDAVRAWFSIPDNRAAFSAKQQRRVETSETRRKKSIAHTGKKLASEHCENISRAKREKLSLAGQRFGFLTISDQCRAGPRRVLFWLCHCDCGAEAWVSSRNLRSGGTRSCGCLRRKTAAQNARGRRQERIRDANGRFLPK